MNRLQKVINAAARLVCLEIRLSPSLDSFKINFKTFLYRDAYINTSCF